MTAVTFPFRFNFEQARRQAKDLHRSLREDEVQAVRRLQAHHPERLTAVQARLADAQLTVAREHGFESWAKLKEYARPKALYQSEPITDGQNRFLSGRHWEDQEARLRRVADEALAKCHIGAKQINQGNSHGDFGFSKFGLSVVTNGKEPSHFVTVHYPYDHFALDEVHRQVASMCAWLFALDQETELVVPVPVADETGALCQLIDHRPDGPAAVCTVQRCVRGKVIAPLAVYEGWDLANESEPIILPKATMYELGVVLGHINNHGRTWARPDGFNRFRIDWMENANEVNRDYWNSREDRLSREDQALLEQTIDAITRYRKGRGEPWELTCGGFRLTTCVEHEGHFHPVEFSPTLTYQFDDIGWFLVDVSDDSMRRAFLDGYLSVAPQQPAFHRLVEVALIAARTRRCAYGGGLPPRLIPECKKYVSEEAFLLGPE